MNASCKSRLDRLDAELQQLLREMERYSEEQINRQPGPGQWSAAQVMHHLILSENLSLQYLRRKLSNAPALGKAGPQTWFREWMLRSYLGAPLKFKAPKIVDVEAMPPHATLPELVSNWTSGRRELRSFMEGLPPDVFDKEAYRHPVAGRITLAGMLDFFAAHFRRHRRQIRRSLP